MTELRKINVVHYTDTYLPISETFIYNIIKNLKSVKPIVISTLVSNLDHFPIDRLYTASSIKRFSWWWLVNLVQYHFGDRNEFFENMLYAKHIIKTNKAKLIHAHFGPSGVKMLPIKRSLKIPIITTFYGYDMSSLPSQGKWKNDYIKLFAEGELFLVEGCHMRKKLIGLGCPENKIKIMHIGVCLEKLKFKERSLKPGMKFIILFCGRFVEKKGLIYALNAVKNLKKKYHNFEFRLIGDGSDREVVEKFIIINNLESNVKLLGYQTHDVFVKQLEETHLLLQPSITAKDGDSEGGAPTVLLEAQASGVPVLSTLHADIPEVVKDGESGYLVPEKDSYSLSERMLYFLDNSDKWSQMGCAGRKHIEKNHDIKKQVKLLESFYINLSKDS